MAVWKTVKNRFRVFTKLKQWFGIRGVKFQLRISPTVAKVKGFLKGTLLIQAKSNQKIKEIILKLKEDWSSGLGEDKTREVFELGQTKVDGFALKKGEKKQIDFQLPFSLIPYQDENPTLEIKQSSPPDPKTEFSKYSIEVIGNVEGTAFGPKASKKIRLV